MFKSILVEVVETIFWNNLKYIYLLILCFISFIFLFFLSTLVFVNVKCQMLRFLFFYIILAKKLLSPSLVKFNEAITNEKLKIPSNSKLNNLNFYSNWKGWRLLYLQVSYLLLFLMNKNIWNILLPNFLIVGFLCHAKVFFSFIYIYIYIWTFL